MRFPEFLGKKGTIGIVAPSFGVSGYPYEIKHAAAIARFRKMGYGIKEAEHIRGIEKGASADPRTRADEFMQMYLDDDVDFILSVAGGELMLQILPYVDFEVLKKAKPKYFMGFSDNTCLTFTLTTLADTAAIYGSNVGSFGMRRWHKAVKESHEVMTGKRLLQQNFLRYEVKNLSKLPGHALDSYNARKKVVYETLGDSDVHMEGRLIGGCLDLLSNICGTKFDRVPEFVERYGSDGILWYLEACDLNTLSQSRSLWQLKNAGWFKNCSGFIFGRPVDSTPLFGIDVREALAAELSELGVPVIFGADIGHLPPSWTLINGSYAKIDKKDSECHIEYILK